MWVQKTLLVLLAVTLMGGCTPVDRSGSAQGNADVNCRGVMEDRVRDCARDTGAQMENDEAERQRALEMSGKKDG